MLIENVIGGTDNTCDVLVIDALEDLGYRLIFLQLNSQLPHRLRARSLNLFQTFDYDAGCTYDCQHLCQVPRAVSHLDHHYF